MQRPTQINEKMHHVEKVKNMCLLSGRQSNNNTHKNNNVESHS